MTATDRYLLVPKGRYTLSDLRLLRHFKSVMDFKNRPIALGPFAAIFGHAWQT